jgi:hypothetical protein
MWTPSADIIITREMREAGALESAWAALRAERDRLIAASDWVILRNLETSEPVPQEWLDYRQALRDLPENTADPASPNWPEPPTT